MKSQPVLSKHVCSSSCAATVDRQFIVIFGTVFMGVFSHVTFFCQSTSVVSWAQFLLGESAADTKLLPKLQPVHLYGTAGLHHTAVSWQVQDGGNVCIQKIFNILTQKQWQ